MRDLSVIKSLAMPSMFKRGGIFLWTLYSISWFFPCKNRLASTSGKFVVMKSSLHTESSSSVISAHSHCTKKVRIWWCRLNQTHHLRLVLDSILVLPSIVENREVLRQRRSSQCRSLLCWYYIWPVKFNALHICLSWTWIEFDFSIKYARFPCLRVRQSVEMNQLRLWRVFKLRDRPAVEPHLQLSLFLQKKTNIIFFSEQHRLRP